MHANLAIMDMTTKILIVDDDKGIRSVIANFLKKHGFHTATAANPVEMRKHLAGETFDLIVLDVMMPKEDGLTALKSLGPDAPSVIMLSAVGADIDRVVGLEMGADDYLAKPCNPRELLARIRSVLRRKATAQALLDQALAAAGSSPAAPPSLPAIAPPAPAAAPSPVQADSTATQCLQFDGWRMDLDMRLLFDPDSKVITLTDGEFRLLRAFAEHPRRVVTRDQLLEWSRGDDVDHFDRAIDVQLSRLRRKLADAGTTGGELIRTVRNEGYIFVPQVTTA